MDPESLLVAIGKDEDVKVEKVDMLIDGKVRNVNAVDVAGNNYVKLRDLKNVIDVGYDVARKMPVVNKHKKTGEFYEIMKLILRCCPRLYNHDRRKSFLVTATPWPSLIGGPF